MPACTSPARSTCPSSDVASAARRRGAAPDRHAPIVAYCGGPDLTARARRAVSLLLRPRLHRRLATIQAVLTEWFESSEPDRPKLARAPGARRRRRRGGRPCSSHRLHAALHAPRTCSHVAHSCTSLVRVRFADASTPPDRSARRLRALARDRRSARGVVHWLAGVAVRALCAAVRQAADRGQVCACPPRPPQASAVTATSSRLRRHRAGSAPRACARRRRRDRSSLDPVRLRGAEVRVAPPAPADRARSTASPSE